MTVVVRYRPTSLTRELYERVNENLRDELGDGPPPDLELHLLFGPDPGLLVSELWESEAAWRRHYDTLLRPAIEAAGIELAAPEVLEVHEMWGSTLARAD